MECFVLSADLMFASQASGAAISAGCPSKTVGRIDAVVTDGAHMVVLDLTMPSLHILDAVTKLKERGAIVVAVGPHVHEEKLNAAKEAGADHVVTKGQASRELPGLLGQIVHDQR